MEILQEMKKQAMVLMITHKLTSARKADLIYVIEEGKVREQGSHLELLEVKGLYQKFWNLQVVE